jgi:hypothetical protein
MIEEITTGQIEMSREDRIVTDILTWLANENIDPSIKELHIVQVFTALDPSTFHIVLGKLVEDIDTINCDENLKTSVRFALLALQAGIDIDTEIPTQKLGAGVNYKKEIMILVAALIIFIGGMLKHAYDKSVMEKIDKASFHLEYEGEDLNSIPGVEL